MEFIILLSVMGIGALIAGVWACIQIRKEGRHSA